MPLDGTWKTLLRLHSGSVMEAVPLFLPDDPAIPAKEVPATAGVKHFQTEKSILQREASTDKNGLQRVAYALLVALAGAWIVSLGWGLRMIDPTPRPGGDDRGKLRRPAVAPSG